MKIDPYNNQKTFSNWLEYVLEHGVENLNKNHSKLLITFIQDLERGQNVSKGSKKGGRSYIRLNALRIRLRQMLEHFESKGISNIKDLKEQQLFDYFDDLDKGRIKRQDGERYTSIRDHLKDFKTFWRWLIKVNKKQGIDLKDITEDLGHRSEEKNFVYITKEELEKILPYFTPKEQTLLWFIFDTIIRSPTELLNVKVSDISKDYTQLSIRQETSKTFGRTIKILLCSDALKKYIEDNQLKPDDLLFDISYNYFSRKLKEVTKEVLGENVSLGGERYSKITLYDFRHSGAIYWRLGAYHSKIDSLMYRGGWNNLDMLNYYTKKLGMKDSVEKSDLLIEADKNELQKKIEDQQKEIENLKAREEARDSMLISIMEHLKKKNLEISESEDLKRFKELANTKPLPTSK